GLAPTLLSIVGKGHQSERGEQRVEAGLVRRGSGRGRIVRFGFSLHPRGFDGSLPQLLSAFPIEAHNDASGPIVSCQKDAIPPNHGRGMSCRDRSPPGKILHGSEFDREIPRLRDPRTIRPAKARPILNARAAGAARSDDERECEHGGGAEAETFQSSAKGEFHIVHASVGDGLKRLWTMTKSE